jgi:hypothetical protein
MNRNSNSEFDVVSLSSSLEDSSLLQKAENESASEYEYEYDYEEEDSVSEEKDAAVVAESRRANQVEIIFPAEHEEGWQLVQPPLSPFSDILLSRAVSHPEPEQKSDAYSTSSSSFVSVDPSSYASVSARVANRQVQNAVNSMTMTSSSWSHVDHSISASVQSISSTMMNSVNSTKSIVSAFELVVTTDGSMRARCKACGYMNQNDQKVAGLCRGCNAVLVNNPCLEMDEALAMTLQQTETKLALVHRKMMASNQTLPFVRAQALATEVTSMVLHRRGGGDDGNRDTSTTCHGTLDINQPEFFACQPLKEMDLTFQASTFIERFEFLRSTGQGFRLASGYAFTRKTAVAEICRDGLPERNCRRLIVSTDPEVALRLKNGLTPLPTSNEDAKVEAETKGKGEEAATDESDKKEPPLSVSEPMCQYHEGDCVGWIVVVVTSLDNYDDWSTVEHKRDEQEDPQKIEILNTKSTYYSCQCLPMAYFDAVHRKDARIASLFQGLSDACFDFFHTDWSLITIDEEQQDDECERDQQDDNANKKNDASSVSSSKATRTPHECSCKGDSSLDEKEIEDLTPPKSENVPSGYCSSDDDTDDDDNESAAKNNII